MGTHLYATMILLTYREQKQMKNCMKTEVTVKQCVTVLNKYVNVSIFNIQTEQVTPGPTV